VKPLSLDQLSHLLREKGYSKRYIKRLTAELGDHLNSAEECEAGRLNESPIAERIGSTAEIANALLEYSELSPIVKRFPLTTFVLLPSILLCLGTMLFVGSLELIANQAHNSQFVSFLPMVPFAANACNILFSAGVAILACWTGWTYRLKIYYPVFSTSVMCVGALFQTAVVYCQISQSVTCFHKWQFDETKFFCLASVLTCFLGFYVLKRIRSRDLGSAAEPI